MSVVDTTGILAEVENETEEWKAETSNTTAEDAPARRDATTPTQVAHPWRAILRTLVSVGLATFLAWLATKGIDLTSFGPALTEYLTEIIAVTLAGIFTGVLAIPSVNRFIERWIPWLATGAQGKELP